MRPFVPQGIKRHKSSKKMIAVVCRMLDVPTTCWYVLGTDLHRRLHWLGHVYRMEDGCILYGELGSGRRTKGRCSNKDVCKRDMKALDINTESWEDLAADRMMWGSTLNQHLKSGEEKLVNAEAEIGPQQNRDHTQMRLLRQRLFLPHRSLQPCCNNQTDRTTRMYSHDQT